MSKKKGKDKKNAKSEGKIWKHGIFRKFEDTEAATPPHLEITARQYRTFRQ